MKSMPTETFAKGMADTEKRDSQNIIHPKIQPVTSTDSINLK
jgi:hypothetical protein